MTKLNGLVGIVFNFPAIVASTSLSSQRAVLIHQFDDRWRSDQPSARPCQIGSTPELPADPHEFPGVLRSHRLPGPNLMPPPRRYTASLTLASFPWARDNLPSGGLRPDGFVGFKAGALTDGQSIHFSGRLGLPSALASAEPSGP
jgi:hypothetical protein